RIYHQGLEDVDVPGLLKMMKDGEEVSDDIRENYRVFDSYQLAFFEYIAKSGLHYSAKNSYWSLP
ncbi:MAG TPA: hypothetical protein DG355_05385, partial [Candidatus Cloacimonas sp.]|nr:hypothetical protein [Candidatus Cloacimonas sp.]